MAAIGVWRHFKSYEGGVSKTDEFAGTRLFSLAHPQNRRVREGVRAMRDSEHHENDTSSGEEDCFGDVSERISLVLDEPYCLSSSIRLLFVITFVHSSLTPSPTFTSINLSSRLHGCFCLILV